MKLNQALIAKSIAETILVATLAIGFYLSTFPPYFHGWAETSPAGIAGWAVDQAKPDRPVEVQLFIDGKFVATATANQSRPDVLSAGWAGDEWHGYSFAPPFGPPGPHLARVYALHSSGGGIRQSLQMLGDPLQINVDEAGKIGQLGLGPGATPSR